MNVVPNTISFGDGRLALATSVGVNVEQSPLCWTPVATAPFHVVRSREQYPVSGALVRTTERVPDAVKEGVTVVGVDANEHWETAPASFTGQLSAIRPPMISR